MDVPVDNTDNVSAAQESCACREEAERTRVVLVDDHALFRRGLRRLLEHQKYRAAAEMLHETFPSQDLTVLVDYYGREVADAIAVCRRFPEVGGTRVQAKRRA